jgi:RHS repeat-associated protein
VGTSGAGTSTYPGARGAQPHTLTSSTTEKPDGTTTASSYTYDSAGNTHTRTVDGKVQTLEWDDEGHLSKATNADGTSASYLYDATGNRLLTRDDSGTTLYLGAEEIHLAKGAATATGTRYYDWGGQSIAVRTSTGSLQWQVTDGHNTAETAVDATTQAVTRRYLDPFGNARGPQDTTGAWLGDKGFVNGVNDSVTGYTHLGAREYDPTNGRFISLDPVLDIADTDQIGGYATAVVIAVVVACTACVLAASAEAALAFTGAAEAGGGNRGRDGDGGRGRSRRTGYVDRPRRRRRRGARRDSGDHGEGRGRGRGRCASGEGRSRRRVRGGRSGRRGARRRGGAEVRFQPGGL